MCFILVCLFIPILPKGMAKRTSKGDNLNKQGISLIASIFKMGTACKVKKLL